MEQVHPFAEHGAGRASPTAMLAGRSSSASRRRAHRARHRARTAGGRSSSRRKRRPAAPRRLKTAVSSSRSDAARRSAPAWTLARGGERQRGHARRRGQRVSVVGAGVRHTPRPGGGAREKAHQVGAPAHRPARHPAGQDLAEHREVRDAPPNFLDSAGRPSESRDHLVIDQQRPGLVCQLPRRGEKAVGERDRSPGRAGGFQDHGGDVASAERVGQDLLIGGQDRQRTVVASGRPAVSGWSKGGSEPTATWSCQPWK